MKKIQIAIDGPAGSGKSTVAKRIANKFNLMYINTGSMYRAVTYFALEKGIKAEESKELIDLTSSLDIIFEGEKIIVNGEDISDVITFPNIANNVSDYAKIGKVREILVNLQQNISKKHSVIMDGRDIGTIVLKDAKYKFFLVADVVERAKRRKKELEGKGIKIELDTLVQDIEKRDYEDSHRKVNPLTKASDAIEIDTSILSIDEVVEKICTFIN